MKGSVDVKPLMLGQKARVKKEWLKTWKILGERLLRLPQWMQNIVLADINNAVQNRLTTMEMIVNATRIPGDS